MKILYNNQFVLIVCFILIVSIISCAPTTRVKNSVSSAISDWEKQKKFTINSEDKRIILNEYIKKSEVVGKLDDLQIRSAVFSFLNCLLDKGKKAKDLPGIIKEKLYEFIGEIFSELLHFFKDWVIKKCSGSKMGALTIHSNVIALIYINGEFLGYSKDEEGVDKKWSLVVDKYLLEVKYNDNIICSQDLEIKNKIHREKTCNYYEK